MHCFSCSAVASTVLTYGEPGPNRGARAGATKWFAEQVEKRSGGDLKIKILWGGALYKATSSRQAIAAGVVDMGTIIPDYFPKELVAFSLTNLPLGNLDPWVGLKANFDHMRSDAVSNNLAQQNLVFVSSYMLSSVIVLCKGQAISSLDDIRDKKIRGVGTFGKIFGDLGANLVGMSIYKAYQGLDNGLLDCTQGYLNTTVALKHHEVADSLTKLNWGIYTGLGMFINQQALRKLSPSQRQVLDEVAADFIDYMGQDVMATDKRAEQLLHSTDQGVDVQIIELPKAESAKLMQASQWHINKWQQDADDSGLDGKSLINNYQSLLRKYTQERDEMGYPWAR
ncbi:MAG: C4-dicarboxylate ABC transporter substrate-binding protein [Alteromonadaceae bacterium]|nr:C4-dicarboxylate ABC transporter substrate-binding protein [Alteromonadaceae bacterium]MBB18076.1 C4-dicarboxylate ABC transporter substrate-binding protein [Rickettsiales bacterium]